MTFHLVGFLLIFVKKFIIKWVIFKWTRHNLFILLFFGKDNPFEADLATCIFDQMAMVHGPIKNESVG